MRVQTAFAMTVVVVGISVCSAQPALPADRELAQWVQRGEGVFDLVLELWATIRPHGRKRPIDAEKALVLWKKIAPQLPKEDLLRQRICYTVAGVFEQSDPARAAKIAEDCTYPAWSASLYRRAGKKDDQRRMSDAAKEHARREDVFKKETRRFIRREADLTAWLGKRPAMKRIEFLTRGVANPWSRQCDRGFSHFVASLPKHVRLRRVMTLYYTPCVSCGLSPIDGELNRAEPILRTTAVAFPAKLGRTYRLLVQAGMGESSWLTGPLRVPGDWGPTGNALRVTGELLRAAPGGQGGDPRGRRGATQGEEDARPAVSLAGAGGLSARRRPRRAPRLGNGAAEEAARHRDRAPMGAGLAAQRVGRGAEEAAEVLDEPRAQRGGSGREEVRDGGRQDPRL